MQLFQPFLFLEFPIHAELAGEAALFAGPGGEAEVEGEGGGVGFYLPAKFKHATAAFDTGGGRAVAVVGGPGVAVKFVLVSHAAVEAALLIEFMCQACAQAQAVAADAVKVIYFVGDAGGVHGDVVAGLPGVEVFDVAVKLVVGGNFAYFAESQVGGDIVAAAVVVYI